MFLLLPFISRMRFREVFYKYIIYLVKFLTSRSFHSINSEKTGQNTVKHIHKYFSNIVVAKEILISYMFFFENIFYFLDF